MMIRQQPNPATTPGDLTSLNWLSSLGIADRTLVDAIAQSSPNPAHVYATTISDPAGVYPQELMWQQTHSTPRRRRSSGQAARSRAPSNSADRLGAAAIQPIVGNKEPRPACSYSCLIAMALKACPAGSLPVHEIYRFIE